MSRFAEVQRVESLNSDKHNHSFDCCEYKLDTDDPIWIQLLWWAMIGFAIGLTIDIIIIPYR